METKKLLLAKNDELMSLNENLYDEFYIQELESRLETDPLAIGGILDMFSQDVSMAEGDCVGYSSCGENSGDLCGINACNCLFACSCILKIW
ncbi:MAG: hypothetical protein LBR10_15815 [Prevotellaceae bacterium]|jgi:hypothetical protein|nr:hypothetical protein [Prevotellaceae bacterium]